MTQLEMTPITEQLPVRQPDNPVEQSLEMFERLLSNPKLDPNGIALILDKMQEWRREYARQEFISARKNFQDRILPPKRTRQVSYPSKGGGTVEFKHPVMSSSLKEIRDCIAPYGFSVNWIPSTADSGKVRVTCVLSHVLGHQESGYLDAEPDSTGGKNGNQAVGSSVTYLERYTIFPMLGIVPEDQPDNDGKPPVEEAWAEERDERLAFFPKCSTLQELQDHWTASYKEAKARKDTQAMDAFNFAKNKRKSELQVTK